MAKRILSLIFAVLMITATITVGVSSAEPVLTGAGTSIAI